MFKKFTSVVLNRDVSSKDAQGEGRWESGDYKSSTVVSGYAENKKWWRTLLSNFHPDSDVVYTEESEE